MSQSNPYQAKKLTATFVDIDGDPADPAEITVSIYREYGGAITQVESVTQDDLENPEVGTFYTVFTPGENGPGIYTVRWITGDGVDVQESWGVGEGMAVS